MTHYITGTKRVLALIAEAARSAGAEFTAAGGRAVLTASRPAADVYLPAGTVPCIHARDGASHQEACRDWL